MSRSGYISSLRGSQRERRYLVKPSPFHKLHSARQSSYRLRLLQTVATAVLAGVTTQENLLDGEWSSVRHVLTSNPGLISSKP